MEWQWTRLLLALVFMTSTGLADDEPVIPPQKFVYCTVCHGVQMGGNFLLAAPRLSGMDQDYVVQQLTAFRNGWRGVHPDDHAGHEMRPMAAALTEREVVEVAKYVNSVASAPSRVTVQGDIERGKALYASCSACHGANAEGNSAVAGPALTGLNDWYLLTQLKNYKAGIRGSHPDDVYGQQMRNAAQLLPDEQAMQDVVRYITTLN